MKIVQISAITILASVLFLSQSMTAGLGATNVYLTNNYGKSITFARQLTEAEQNAKKAQKSEKGDGEAALKDEWIDTFELEENVADNMTEETKVETGKDIQILSMPRNVLGIGELTKTETIVLDIAGTKIFLYVTTAAWGFNVAVCTKDHRCVFLPAPNGSVTLVKDNVEMKVNTYLESLIPNVRFVVEEKKKSK